MQQKRGTEFAQLVHRSLVIDKQWTIEQVAEGLGMKYDTFYGRLIGRVPFSPEEVWAVLKVAPDIRFIEYFLEETDFVAVDRIKFEGERTGKEIMDTAVNSVHAVSDVLKETNQSLADNRLDHQDRARIRSELDEAERELATLRTLLERG